MRSAYFGSTKGRIPDLRSHGDCILVLKIGFDEVRSHWVCIIFHHPLDELRYTGLKVVRSILVTAGCDAVAGADVFSFLFPVGQIGVHAAQQPDTCFVTNPQMCWAISPDDYEHCPSNNKATETDYRHQEVLFLLLPLYPHHARLCVSDHGMQPNVLTLTWNGSFLFAFLQRVAYYIVWCMVWMGTSRLWSSVWEGWRRVVVSICVSGWSVYQLLCRDLGSC